MREPDWQSEDGSIRLYRGDCLEVMPELTETVDAVICDLPYGTTQCRWDTVIPFEPLWASYKRVIKPSGAIVLFGSQPFTSALVMSNAKQFKHEWIWEKSRATGHLDCKRRPLRKHEIISVFGAAPVRYNPQMRLGMKHSRGGAKTGPAAVWGKFTDRRETESEDYYPLSILPFPVALKPSHPTQKPVALLEYLISTYTNEGETVLDNTFGSGTAAVACINTGRKFIGIERDPDYFDVAVKRCEDALAARQGSLFPNDEAPVAV